MRPGEGDRAAATILLVAAPGHFRTMIRRLLEARGFTVELHAGDDAPEPERRRVDLAIVDLAAGQERLYGPAPVLYLANANDPVVPGCSYLRKPFTPDELEQRVRAPLDRR